MVKYAYSPKEYSVLLQSSKDAQWVQQTAFQPTVPLRLQTYDYVQPRALLSHVHLTRPQQALKVRILMKGPVNVRFGVYRVEVLGRIFSGGLIFREKGIDKCLVSFKGKESKVQLIDCVLGVSLFDGRDIWELQENLDIVSVSNRECLGLFRGVYEPGSYGQTGDCLAAA